MRPFSDRPHDYLGVAGEHARDYADPQATWWNAERVFLTRTATLREKRKEMYHDYLARLTYFIRGRSHGNMTLTRRLRQASKDCYNT
ncbi:MAG: hypothetical protein AAF961_12800 [Planctomycetota bacterium]